jgi:2-octaprenyl-6-methoxyphenol hydroxylase
VAEHSDIVIAGGGPVGAALALGLRASGLRVTLVEARVPGAAVDEARTIALAHGSRLILERLGVWPALAPETTAIHCISISQQRSFGRTELSAREANVPALGYVAGYAALQRALVGALERTTVRVLAGCAVQAVRGDANGAVVSVDASGTRQELVARLAAIADGGAQLDIAHVKTRDYRQSALVCDVVSEQLHQNRAFERFTPEGPLALLPTARGWSLVWTVPPECAQQLAAQDDAEFCRRLQAVFGSAAGAFSAAGRRQVFPLALKYATRPVAPRTLLIGNAAQTLHPVAGQGFNLGLRDAWELARAVLARGTSDPGGSELLNEYFSQRRCDRIATILFTDTLIRLFCKDIPLLHGVRGLGLAAFGAIPAAKNLLARRMMFGARG